MMQGEPPRETIYKMVSMKSIPKSQKQIKSSLYIYFLKADKQKSKQNKTNKQNFPWPSAHFMFPNTPSSPYLTPYSYYYSFVSIIQIPSFSVSAPFNTSLLYYFPLFILS